VQVKKSERIVINRVMETKDMPEKRRIEAIKKDK